MEMEELKIKKYSFKKDSGEYIIYLIPEDNNITSFYIQKKDYGFIDHTIGFDLKMLERNSIENFINENLDGWIFIYNEQIDILESNN